MGAAGWIGMSFMILTRRADLLASSEGPGQDRADK